MHVYNKWVIHLKHYHTLQIDVFNRILVQDDVFSHTFHSVELLILRRVNEKDLAKGTSTNTRDHLELFEVNSISFTTLRV